MREPSITVRRPRRRSAIRWGWILAHIAGALVLVGLGYGLAQALTAEIEAREAASVQAASQILGRPGRPTLLRDEATERR